MLYEVITDYGYNFITVHPDDNSEFTMTFQKMDESLLERFDLNSEIYIGKRFKVLYHLSLFA